MDRHAKSGPASQYQSPSAVAAAKSLQLCPTLWDPMDSSPPGSPIPGILQARTLEWVAISFSNAWKWKVKVTSLSRVQLLATPWTAAHQAPPSMEFSRQEYWSGVPLPSPNLLLLDSNYHQSQWLCLFSNRNSTLLQCFTYVTEVFEELGVKSLVPLCILHFLKIKKVLIYVR